MTPCPTMTYKFIRIGAPVDGEQFSGKPIYWVTNLKSGPAIGQIFWYAAWRRWTARFDPDSVWSADCLRDVASYLEQLNKAPKA
jgi:hypothetical protein